MDAAPPELHDVASRREQKDGPLYTGRVQVHPKRVDGPVRRLKWAALALLLGFYYFGSWLRWDRGPDAPSQALLIDLPGRKGYFFGLEIYPQEVYFLAGALILSAIGLFLVTAAFGRIWCGFACPQTVWTDLFMLVESWIEGDRNARIRLDKAPWTAGKIAKRAAKHAAWLVIALFTGGAWVMYFQDAPTLVREFFTGQSGRGTYFFVALFTATTYLLAGWAREQVCTYMCPWPRIQGALLDADSAAVSYQAWRGEPRGKAPKDGDYAGRGDCIDCKLCVAVCPTGIDIRDGLQIECIGCGLCIDACNSVMPKIGRPGGLITFISARNLTQRAAGQPVTRRIIRPRTVLYAALLALGGALMLWGLFTKADIDLKVLHDRAPLYVRLSDGAIRNGYVLKLTNRKREERHYALTFQGPAGARLSLPEGDSGRITLRPDETLPLVVRLAVPAERLAGHEADVTFTLTDLDTGQTVSRDSTFLSPRSRR